MSQITAGARTAGSHTTTSTLTAATTIPFPTIAAGTYVPPTSGVINDGNIRNPTTLMIQVAGQTCNITFDGTAPVAATTGFTLAVGTVYTFPVDISMKIQTIQNAVSATAQYQFLY